MNFDDLYLLLLRRGFLIDRGQDAWYLSDNAEKGDFQYLDKLLKTFNMGYLENTKIIISRPENSSRLQCLFQATTRNNRIGWEEVYSNYFNWESWSAFARFEHGRKVPVEILEPNIALYCKALSACGVDTAFSCDGNHEKQTDNVALGFRSGPYLLWHNFLWKYILLPRFQLKWESNDGSLIRIPVNQENRSLVYNELFFAGVFLYNNRKTFREIKKISADVIQKRYFRHHKDGTDYIKSELELRFISQLNTVHWKESYQSLCK